MKNTENYYITFHPVGQGFGSEVVVTGGYGVAPSANFSQATRCILEQAAMLHSPPKCPALTYPHSPTKNYQKNGARVSDSAVTR